MTQSLRGPGQAEWRMPARAMIAVVFIVAATFAGARAQPDFIAAAKRIPAKSLDSAVADIPLERWLSEISGAAVTAIHWEVNDCGEGGDGRKAPTCVEATVPLRADTVAAMSLVVAGVDGKASSPVVWSLVVGSGTKFTTFNTVATWAAAVRARRR